VSKPTKKSRGLVVNAILIAVALGLLGVVVYRNRERLHEVFERGVDPWMFALAFGVYCVAIVLTFVRWYVLVRVVEPRFTLGAAVRLGFIGNVFNLVIPGAVGGDFIKAAYLVKMDINRTQAVASMVIDRILGLLGLFQLAGAAGIIAWPMATHEVRILIALIWSAVAAGYLALFAIFNQALTKRYPQLLDGHGRIAAILRELKTMSETYRKKLHVVGGCLLASSGFHLLFVVAFYIVSRALFPAHLPGFAQHLLIAPMSLFTTAVPLPFGALGLSEGISGQLFAMVDHPGGSIAMMGFRVLMYAGGLLSVCVYLANIRQVRALTETAEELEDELATDTLEEHDAVKS
jgi:glycosyltransferase 2 family protein